MHHLQVTLLAPSGNIKLDRFSELCVQGSWLKDISSYTVDISAYSTGLTILQVGQKSVTVSASFEYNSLGFQP